MKDWTPKSGQVVKNTGVLKLIADAIDNYKKDRVLRKYEQGKISISRAAEEAGLTVGEIEEYMVRKGYMSCRSSRYASSAASLRRAWGRRRGWRERGRRN